VRCRNRCPTSQKIWGGFVCTECTGQGNDFELIPMVTMGTRLSVEGSLGNKCPSIYNHCGAITAERSRKLPNFAFFDVFGEKRSLMGKCSKFCSELIHRDTDRRAVFKFREIWPTGNR